jgi:3-keto-disaccharide hydrolase
MKTRNLLLVTVILLSLSSITRGQSTTEAGFKSIFDGKSFNGWKMANENQNSWTIKDGAIVAQGEKSHLYYVGDNKPLTDFELKIDVMTEPGSNGGIYFHTLYQETDWPKKGYEVQVNQTHKDWRKTGSLYGVQDVKEQLVKDNEWYTYHIIVKGKHITIKINDKVAVDWEEPADRKPGTDFTRILDKGTIALQAHDPNSTVRYKNIRIKRLD